MKAIPFVIWLVVAAVLWIGGNALISYLTGSFPVDAAWRLPVHRLVVIVGRVLQIGWTVMAGFYALWGASIMGSR